MSFLAYFVYITRFDYSIGGKGGKLLITVLKHIEGIIFWCDSNFNLLLYREVLIVDKDAKKKISIVIPSVGDLYNINISKGEFKCEIVVIFDGVKGKIIGGDSRARVFYQAKKGPAAARNLGIKKAKGEIILFLGDDILATKNLIENHEKMHEKYKDNNVAVLGYLRYPKRYLDCPLYEFLENSGTQFAYCSISERRRLNFEHFYSSNISVKKSFLLENGLFDENFKYSAYEDTELGYRLEKKGLKIIFCKKAEGIHKHPIGVASYCKRMLKAGRSAKIMLKKHPELKGRVVKVTFSVGEIVRFLICLPFFPIGYVFGVKKIYYPVYGFVFKLFLILGYNYEARKKYERAFCNYFKP